MRIQRPIFYITVILFFVKEFSILFTWNLFVEKIADFVFLLIFSIFTLFYIGPMFRPEWVEGYELPDYEDDVEEEEELSDEEKELRDLERISL